MTPYRKDGRLIRGYSNDSAGQGCVSNTEGLSLDLSVGDRVVVKSRKSESPGRIVAVNEDQFLVQHNGVEQWLGRDNLLFEPADDDYEARVELVRSGWSESESSRRDQYGRGAIEIQSVRSDFWETGIA